MADFTTDQELDFNRKRLATAKEMLRSNVEWVRQVNDLPSTDERRSINQVLATEELQVATTYLCNILNEDLDRGWTADYGGRLLAATDRVVKVADYLATWYDKNWRVYSTYGVLETIQRAANECCDARRWYWAWCERYNLECDNKMPEWDNLESATSIYHRISNLD